MRIRISDLKRIIKEELNYHYGQEICVACGTPYIDGEGGDRVLGLCSACEQDPNTEGLDDLDMEGSADDLSSDFYDEDDMLDDEYNDTFMYEADYSKDDLKKMRKDAGLQHNYDTFHGKKNAEPDPRVASKDYNRDWADWVGPSSISKSGVELDDLDNDEELQLVTKPLANYVRNKSTTPGMEFDDADADMNDVSWNHQDFVPSSNVTKPGLALDDLDDDDFEIDLD